MSPLNPGDLSLTSESHHRRSDLCETPRDHPQRRGGTAREIENAAMDKGPAIIDGNVDAATRHQIDDVQACAKRQGAVRGSHPIRIEGNAASNLMAFEIIRRRAEEFAGATLTKGKPRTHNRTARSPVCRGAVRSAASRQSMRTVLRHGCTPVPVARGLNFFVLGSRTGRWIQ
jgi:hypothetical protein